MPTIITCYERPAAEAAPPASAARQLFRAITPDARFGYIELSDAPPADAAAALTGRYEAFHCNSEPAPPFGKDASASSIMFVNCMQFEPDGHDAAFELWQQVNAYMVDKPGYRWHRLHRRVDPDAPFGLINVVEWESEAAWQAAHDAGFRDRASRREMPFTAFPTLCQPV